MRLLSLLLCFLLLSSISFSQDAKGYYINLQGDTLRGQIALPIKKDAIRFDKMTFDVKFTQDGQKPKKIDRLSAKGFGFVYDGRNYEFVTWDVKASKQIYLPSPLGDVAPNGVYFILKTEDGSWPLYSLFQMVEDKRSVLNDPSKNSPSAYRQEFNGYKVKREIIFKHPTKGFQLLSGKYPLLMRFSETLKYLEMEEDFIKTLQKKQKNLLEIVKEYNSWKVLQG